MRLAILLSTVLLMLRISALAQGEPQKLAEGKYLMTANGQPGQTQQWTLWRRPDGSYQLENHFHIANEAAEVVAALGPGHLSRELKAELHVQ